MGIEPVSAAGDGGKGSVSAEPGRAGVIDKESVLADSGHGEGTRFGASGEWAGVIEGVIRVRALKVKECG